MEDPGALKTIGGALVPASRDDDVDASISVDVAHAHAMMICPDIGRAWLADRGGHPGLGGVIAGNGPDEGVRASQSKDELLLISVSEEVLVDRPLAARDLSRRNDQIRVPVPILAGGVLVPA